MLWTKACLDVFRLQVQDPDTDRAPQKALGRGDPRAAGSLWINVILRDQSTPACHKIAPAESRSSSTC